MLKRVFLSFCFLLFADYIFCAVFNVCEVRGVRPTDKISTFEVTPALSVINDEGGTSVTTTTLKYYYAFWQKRMSIGAEMPFSRYESPQTSVNGLGDLLMSATFTQPKGMAAYGVQLDTYLPTADARELGTGKLQLSPAAFLDITLPNDIFFAFGYKHYVSVAGKADRANISKGRAEAIVGYLSPYSWWFLVDNKYYKDFTQNSVAGYTVEAELGVMLYEQLSLRIKPGWKVGGNMALNDWSVEFGIKLLDL